MIGDHKVFCRKRRDSVIGLAAPAHAVRIQTSRFVVTDFESAINDHQGIVGL